MPVIPGNFMKETAFKCPLIYFPPLIAEITGTGFVHADPGEIISAHRHQIYEIHYCQKGEIKIRIGKRHLDILENQIFIIKPGDMHYQYFITKTTLFYMKISVIEWDRRSPRQKPGPDNPIMNLLKCDSQVFEADAAIKELMEQTIPQTVKNIGTYNYPVQENIGRFIIAIGRLMTGKKPKYVSPGGVRLELLDKKSRKIIGPIIRHVARNYAAPINMLQMAREASLSQRHFERLFKKATGSTLSQYIVEKRIQRALQLIKKTDLKIDSVITMSGFRNRGNFYKIFTKRTGFSPESFRKSLITSTSHPLGALPTLN
jgi:AraC-like DNA-binding protein